MAIELVIYQGEQEEHLPRLAIAPVLRTAALRQIGEQARHGKLELRLEEPADDEPWPGPPRLRNLSRKYGHCRLTVLREGTAIREEHLRITELFGPVLADLLGELRPTAEHWGFELRERRSGTLVLVTGKLAELLTGGERPAPEAKGAVDVDPGEPRHRPFTLTPIAAADAEQVEPESLGLDPARLGRINVLMPAAIHDEFLHRMPLSDRMEEGGFLLGRVSTAGPDIHLVEITHVTSAHRSGAGAVHFTFTGDSFLDVARLIAERDRDEMLVGWFHTHLFGMGANNEMGLSSIDVDLHLATFQRPWQVAALLNLDRKGRVLRFYGRDDKKLREYDQWIADDSGKYRPADRPVGGR